MWVLKRSSAAQRRADRLFATEKFDFNKEEVELIYKLTGFDLLTTSEMRAALLLFASQS